LAHQAQQLGTVLDRQRCIANVTLNQCAGQDFGVPTGPCLEFFWTSAKALLPVVMDNLTALWAGPTPHPQPACATIRSPNEACRFLILKEFKN
jgi:hypothetical protein